jgi:hypothetical protein
MGQLAVISILLFLSPSNRGVAWAQSYYDDGSAGGGGDPYGDGVAADSSYENDNLYADYAARQETKESGMIKSPGYVNANVRKILIQTMPNFLSF